MIGKKKLIGMAVAFTIIGIIVGLTLSSRLDIQQNAFSKDVEVSKEAVDTLSKVSKAMVEVVAAVRPAVVNISTTRKARLRGQAGPFSDDPFFRRFFGDDFFRQFEEPEERMTASLGSGVIVDKRGYILTNNHVIKDADEIKVTLSNQKEFTGKKVGTDPKTDLAVIKIETDDLPVAKWGDSDRLDVGEMVIAVGSPYGLNQTVTSGIVSAKGRANVRIADYEDFIQTDAAINPGNSGGPLINIRGELVGINTAIFSTTGGYQGIGFAIPSNMAKAVLESLLKEGKVVRGWLGVTIQPVTKELAGQFGLKEEKGALISDVMDDSPAAKSGIERGDLVIEYDGKPVEDPTALRTMVAQTPPGKEARLKIIREGKEITLVVKIGELPDGLPGQPGAYENILKGVTVQDITAELRRNLRIPDRIKGVVVAGVEEAVGLRPGDVIMEVDKKKVESLKEYDAAASKISPDSDVLLLIYREGGIFYMTLRSGK